jgi:hypothetical protein
VPQALHCCSDHVVFAAGLHLNSFLCAHVSDFYFTTRRPTTLIQASALDKFLINDDYISFHCEAPETEVAADGRKRLCLSMDDAGQ